MLENIEEYYKTIENKIILKHCFSHTEIQNKINEGNGIVDQ